jgi:hypothetical protein
MIQRQAVLAKPHVPPMFRSGRGLPISPQLADANNWALAFSARPGGGTIASLHIELQVSE